MSFFGERDNCRNETELSKNGFCGKGEATIVLPIPPRDVLEILSDPKYATNIFSNRICEITGISSPNGEELDVDSVRKKGGKFEAEGAVLAVPTQATFEITAYEDSKLAVKCNEVSAFGLSHPLDLIVEYNLSEKQGNTLLGLSVECHIEGMLGKLLRMFSSNPDKTITKEAFAAGQRINKLIQQIALQE